MKDTEAANKAIKIGSGPITVFLYSKLDLLGINPLQNDKILALSKLTGLADDKCYSKYLIYIL